MSSPAPPPADALAGLRDALATGGYTLDAIGDLLGDRAARALHREHRTPADLVTREHDSPVATLVRLWALGLPVPPASLDRALPGWDTDRLTAVGLVDRTAAGVRAAFDLRPYGDETHQWWVLSDLSEVMTGRPLEPDHVLGIGGASTTLASWTPRPTAARALDLGTGCGVQSLHLSTHVEQVVATDTSTRALDLARLNAALNGLDWDLRRGDLLAPVEGDRFDLIVSNPPFVITPRTGDLPAYEYRDGGRVGHEIVQTLVRTLGEHLVPGGVAQLLGNWEVPAGGDWRDVVGDWLASSELDGWAVQRDSQDPAEYAELWAGDGGHRPGTPGFEQMYAAWLRDFDGRGVERIGFGVLTLHRPAAARAPWRELSEVTGQVASPMGPTIETGLQARSWLAEHGDAAVLGTRWRCGPDVTEERYTTPGAEDPSVILLRQGGGLSTVVRAGTVLAAFVSVCDGDLSAGQALDAIADLLGASPDAVRDEALPEIRRMVADGLLTE